MHTLNKLLRRITLVMTSITLVSLMVAAVGAVVEVVYLAYFWYLALAGIAAIMMTSVAVGLGLIACRCFRWYRRQLESWDGHPVGA